MDIDTDLVELTEKLIKNYNLKGDCSSGVDYNNKIFEMRRPYYGTCDCGWDSKVERFKHNHSKKCFQSQLQEYIKNLDPEIEYMETQWISKVSWFAKSRGYKQGLVGCFDHCTCGHNKTWDKWYKENKKGENGHSASCSLELPNFKHYKSGLEVRWFKWIGRGMEIKGDIKVWDKIYKEVIKSIS